MTRFCAVLFTLLAAMAYSQKKWTLQEAVNYAVENNLQVRSTDYNRQIQENTLEISKREKLPRVSGNLSNNFNFGQGQDVFGNSRRNDNFNNNANVAADVLLFNNGRLEKTVQRNELDLEASNSDLEKIKNDISLQVAEQYLNVLLNKEIEKINQSALENADKMYRRAKITTEVGTTARTVLAEAEAALAREKQNVKTAEINTERSLFALAQLLQIEDYKNFDVEDVALQNSLDAPLYSAQQVIDKAYENQPQIKASEFRIKAAEAQTEVVKTSFWPTISANAGIGTFYYNSLVTNNVGTPQMYIQEYGFFKQYKNNFGQQVGISANIPIFNKGITKLQVEQAKINEEIAKNTLALQRQDVLQNVQRAQFNAESNYEVYLAAVEAEKSSALALDFAEKSYEAGRTTIYDLNIARNNYANAKGSVAQSKYNYLFSQKLLNFYAGIPLSL